MRGRSVTPLAVSDSDNPETIRFKKYATGLHLILQRTGMEKAQTPRETVWARDKARLYHYRPAMYE